MQKFQLILFISCCAAVVLVIRADDWTASCPAGCTCKWTNGKKSVKCNDLQLTTIPKTLHTDVQSLQLNGNNIAVLGREEFNALGLVNLQRIYLKRSHISNISRDAFRNLKILVELDLSENAIETIDKQTFNGNDRLRYLYLYGNPLKRLGAYQFPALPHLRTLDLHDCQISQIDATAFANLELLELLNLKNNLVELVDEHVFNYMKNLKTLVLEGNPWKCNCKLRRFRNWYIKSNLNSLSLMCSSPFVFKNKQWQDVDEIQFACPPKVDIYYDNLYGMDIGSNVTFGCLIYGDPLPEATWDFNGRGFETDTDNVSFDEEQYSDTLWRNLTIFNITNFDAGVYVCSAKNINGQTSKANVTLTLTEMVQHVIEKGPETFWYFGLILGTFGTVFTLIITAILVCWCQKTTARRRSLKNIKGSVSFNDQEKKLLDLSITTNDRQDSCEMGATSHHGGGSGGHQQQHQQQHQQNGIALEPIQITIENQHHQQQQLQQQQQRMGSPMAALGLVSPACEMATATTSASNSSQSGQSSSSSASQQSSVRGCGVAPLSAAAAAAAAAAATNTAHHHHHHRGTCPLSRPSMPTFHVSPGPMPPYGSIFIALAMNPDDQIGGGGGGGSGGGAGDYHIYPDLLNDTAPTQQAQQQVIGALYPDSSAALSAAAAAYATLPRNRAGGQLRLAANSSGGGGGGQKAATTAASAKFSRVPEYDPPDLHACNNLCLQNIINYHNLEARLCGGTGADSLCALCLRDTSHDIHQHQQHHPHHQHPNPKHAQPYRVVGSTASSGPQQRHPAASAEPHTADPAIGKMASSASTTTSTMRRGGGAGSLSVTAATTTTTKYDNMGRRITASGNSTLSLPDEDDELQLGGNGLAAPAPPQLKSSSSAATRRSSFARDTSGGSLQTSGGGAGAGADGSGVSTVSRLVLPLGCDYVSL